jgi:hypothetical protein
MYINAWRQVAPVSFYGRVIDESGRPLRDVEVEVILGTVNPLFIFGAEKPTARRTLILKTDDNGLFRVEGRYGHSLIVWDLRHPRYVFKPRIEGGGNTGFYFAGAGAHPPHRPDPQHPVSFKKQED